MEATCGNGNAPVRGMPAMMMMLNRFQAAVRQYKLQLHCNCILSIFRPPQYRTSFMIDETMNDDDDDGAGGGTVRSTDQYDEAAEADDVVRLAELVFDRLQVRQPDALHVPTAPASSYLQLTACPTGQPIISISVMYS